MSYPDNLNKYPKSMTDFTEFFIKFKSNSYLNLTSMMQIRYVVERDGKFCHKGS